MKEQDRIYLTYPKDQHRAHVERSKTVGIRIQPIIRALLEIWETGVLDSRVERIVKTFKSNNTHYKTKV